MTRKEWKNLKGMHEIQETCNSRKCKECPYKNKSERFISCLAVRGGGGVPAHWELPDLPEKPDKKKAQNQAHYSRSYCISFERSHWTLELKGIQQKFRWINAGEFNMGSPEDEPERSDNETLHKVILTKGYWMAETACTQKLWEAVMGNNPSEVKGEQLPVENISWEDCQEFIQKINKIIPGLGVRLPTEAEWEYACRAGTTTPFSFGENITTDQVNYDGNNPYPGGKKGEYREKTVEVKTLPCNPWGLYEMHGNVAEWCEDLYGDYGTATAIDPRGPETGNFRVLRSGSWYCNARYTRSANRFLYWPSDRDGRIGFRLACDEGK